MMIPSPRRVVFAALLASLALGFLVSAASAGEGPVVREIVVRGVKGDPASITDIIKIKVGAPLSGETVLEDTQRLREAGYLANFRMQTVPDGVRLIIEITPPPRIRNVTITGAGRTWDKSLKDELLTKTGSIVLPAMLQLAEEKQFLGDKKRILAWVTERGFRNAKVVAATAPVEGTDQVDLTFTVDLGAKHQVTALRFEGNQALSTRELKGRMRTKKDGWFSSHRYSDEIFEDDMYGAAGIQQYYRFKGFPNAKVTYVRNFRGSKSNHVEITVRIEEGRQYPVAAITTAGNKAIDTETLLKAIPLKPGDIYSDEKFIEASNVIERLYKRQGYPDVDLKQPTPQLNAAGDAYDVTFTIEDGERVTISQVRTRGNIQTRQDVIFRELELQPGMEYDVRKLERSERALNRLGFFDEVTLELVPTDPPSDKERDLLVTVAEGHTGMFRFGAGYSTTNEVVGAIDLTQRNFDWRRTPKRWSELFSGNAFTGAGQFFRIALMPGNVYSNYLIQYENPYWKHTEDGRNESFGWSLYYRTRDQGEWDENRAGLRLSRGLRKYKGDPDTDLTFHTRLETVNVDNVDEERAPEGAVDDEGSHVLFGLGATITRDRTDRVYLPTTGTRWELSSEGVVPYGVKLGAGATRYWSLGKRPPFHERVFSLRGSMDYAIGSFPIFERYYAGAPLIRGFEYRGAGPHSNGEPDGGDYRAIIGAQYRHPLVARTLYGVLFFDTGTVTENFSLYGDPRASLGFGIRLFLPFLSRAPLSLDFGFPVADQSDDDTQTVYFSLALPWGAGRAKDHGTGDADLTPMPGDE